jgi:hypothetical protein
LNPTSELKGGEPGTTTRNPLDDEDSDEIE